MLAQSKGLWFALVVVGLGGTSLFAQGNLLNNASFEVPDETCAPPGAPPNQAVWVGDYHVYYCPGGSCDAGCGSRAHKPSPVTMDGEQVWEISGGAGTSKTMGAFQTVAVSPGATVAFTGYVDVGPGGTDIINDATVNIWDGGVGGVLIDSGTVDETVAPTHDSWVQLNLSGTANSGTVTVEFIARAINNSGGGAAAVHLDAFSLTSSANCSAQHAVTGISPDAWPQNGDATGVVISGSNLNLVSAVKLIDAGRGFILDGAITSATSGQLTVDFATSTAPAGTYNVVTEQPDCLTQVSVDGFTVLDANLLLNGSFEFEQNQGNGQMWFGDYVTYSIPNESGARIHVPTPNHVDGEWGVEYSTQADAFDQTLWQTVPVVSGQPLVFRGYVHVGPSVNATNEATITLYDGLPGGTEIGSVFVDKTTPHTFGSWVEVQIAGTPTSGLVTLKAVANLVSPGWGVDYIAAVHYEAFSLIADQVCTSPHELYAVVPTTGPHNADAIGVSISGANLSGATAAKLVFVDDPAKGDEVEIVLDGSITSATSGSLTVDFPTSGQPVRSYNVVVEKPGCPTQVLVDAFEIQCANPTELATMTPYQLNSPQGVVEFTVVGLNLDMLAGAWLVIGETTISGTILSATVAQMQVEFDLTNAKIGPYTLTAVRSDLCPDPAPLVAAFTLRRTIEERLVNGTFDEFGNKTKDTQITADEGWARVGGVGPAPVYDGTAWTPEGSAEPGGAKHLSDNRGSVSKGGNSPAIARIFQTVNLPTNREVTLTGFIAGKSSSVVANHRIILRDGGTEGDELASFRWDTDASSGWRTFSIMGLPTAGSVTVEWGFEHGPVGWNDAAATHVDELSLLQAGCNVPFADADDDGDVDQQDFAVFQLCATGAFPGIPPTPSYCTCFDVNTDDQINQTDFRAFVDCSTGPGVAFDPDNPGDCVPTP